MFKKRAGVVLDPIIHVLGVFSTASKTFLKKRVHRFHNNYGFVNVGNLHTRKTV